MKLIYGHTALKIERGLVNFSLDTLVRLCEIFEIPFSALFSLLDTGRGGASEDRVAVAVKVAKALKGKNKAKIKKLRVFLDEIL